MRKGPGNKQRRADVTGAAITRMAAHEETDAAGFKSAAAALGRRGGQARAANLSKRRRKEIARKAAAKRWE